MALETLLLSLAAAGRAVGASRQAIVSGFHAGVTGATIHKTGGDRLPGPHSTFIRARDGVLLHTVWTLPGSDREGQTYPTVIDRSPYGDTGTELVADAFVPEGFAALGQDFRGTYLSGGNFSLWRDMYNDTCDTISWILTQQWSNGDIHLAGGSADGIAALVLAAHPPLPAVKSQFIIWATALPYETIFPGGAYRYGLIHNWLHHYIKKTNATELEREALSHESPLDPWWNPVTPDLDHVTAPTVFWAGWYDIFLNGNIAAFEGWQKSTAKSWLVIDPLGHCQEAGDQFPHSGVEGRVALSVLLGVSLFKGELNTPGHTPPEEVDRVTFFLMGANYSGAAGNHWTTRASWPPVGQLENLYFHADGKLASERSPTSSTRSFDYDPTNPVPTIGGNNLEIPCGPKDQRPVEARDDVLVFTSTILDAPKAVVGKLSVSLFVSSEKVNDTDWTAKLTDVYPDGSSHLIQDGIVRMRWRHAGSAPVPIKSGEVNMITVDLWSTAYVFSKGHRLRVAISSSNSPRFLANPNTGLPLSSFSTETKVARNTLHMSLERASHISLPVVALADMPPHIVV